jgi:tetratricopeptide (TPR) repeat protein
MRSRKSKSARRTADIAPHTDAMHADGASSDGASSDGASSGVDTPAQMDLTDAPTSHTASVPSDDATVSADVTDTSDATVAAQFDASVEGPEAQIAGEAEEPQDPRELLIVLRQRVLDNPSDTAARVRLGALHDARAEPLLALEQYQAAVAAEPDNAAVVLTYAQALTNLNRFADAERELRRMLKTEPENGSLHLQLGTISFRRGLYSQAEIELKRAIELLPDAAYAYFHRGESLNQLSRIDEALDMLERGVALDPTYSRAYYIMGILYDRKSRPQEAGAMYKRAREVAGT